MALTRKAMEAWLLDYAWNGTVEEKRREVECIMAHTTMAFVDGRTEVMVGQAWEPGAEGGYDEAREHVLSSLYECHDAPHLTTCPNFARGGEHEVFTVTVPGRVAEDWASREMAASYEAGSELARPNPYRKVPAEGGPVNVVRVELAEWLADAECCCDADGPGADLEPALRGAYRRLWSAIETLTTVIAAVDVAWAVGS